MFNVKNVILNYSTNTPPTIYTFSDTNYIYGPNDIGKTILLKIIDFILGKTEYNIRNEEGMKNIVYIESCISNNNKSIYLKRTMNNDFFYKKNINTDYIKTDITLYKKEIMMLINNCNSEYEFNYLISTGEHLSNRSFSFINFIDEKDIGNIENIFLNSDKSYYSRKRVNQFISFIFNYENIKQMSLLEKDIQNKEKQIEANLLVNSKYDYFISLIKSNMEDLKLDFNNDLPALRKTFNNYKNDFKRELKKNVKKESDLSSLLKISYDLSEEIKYQTELANQADKLIKKKDRVIKLLSVFKSLPDNGKYSEFISEICKLIKEQESENAVLSFKDYKKTIDSIEDKKRRIDNSIKSISSGLAKRSFDETARKIDLIEHAFDEIKNIDITLIKNNEILSKEIKEKRKKIKELDFSYDNNSINDFEQKLNSSYGSISGKALKFVYNDLKEKNFKIHFDYRQKTLYGSKETNSKDNDYIPGSNARKTVWQILAYLSIFEIINKKFPNLPVMRVLCIDGMNQPFDENQDGFFEFYNTIRIISKNLGVQLFVVSTVKKNTDGDCVIDLSDGLNKSYAN